MKDSFKTHYPCKEKDFSLCFGRLVSGEDDHFKISEKIVQAELKLNNVSQEQRPQAFSCEPQRTDEALSLGFLTLPRRSPVKKAANQSTLQRTKSLKQPLTSIMDPLPEEGASANLSKKPLERAQTLSTLPQETEKPLKRVGSFFNRFRGKNTQQPSVKLQNPKPLDGSALTYLPEAQPASSSTLPRKPKPKTPLTRAFSLMKL